jgi:phosphoglycolate phosphatase-like HAD superfamily hydrolase
MIVAVAPINRRTLLVTLAAAGLYRGSAFAQAPGPLPSWSDRTRQSIMNFVDRVTREGGPDYVAPAERIATFDNDGTLWCEKPLPVQGAFALDRVKAMAPQHPEWQDKQPFKAVLEGNPEALLAFGEKGIFEILAVTHSGMTTDAFSKIAADWFAMARHPRFSRPYSELAYQPMLELLTYLRANGFKTFIVSGGGVEFMRVITDRVYGISPEQVVGSSGVTKFEMGPNGTPVLMKDPKIQFVDGGRASPRESTVTLAAVRSSPSEIRTATGKCCNGQRPAAAPASWGSCITPMPSANTPIPSSSSTPSTRRSTRPTPRAGWLWT